MEAASKPSLKAKNNHLYKPVATVLLTIAVFLVPQFIAVILVSVYPSIKGWSEEQSISWLSNSTTAQFLVRLLVALITINAVLYLIKKARAKPARIGLVRPRLRDIGYALVAYGLYFATYIVLISATDKLFPSINLNQEQDIGFDKVVSQLHLFMAFFSLVILPPLWEEIVFRGFMFTSLRAKMRLRWAIIITSILFAVVHLQIGNGEPLLWVAAIDTFVLSCYLCYLREKTGSLWAPMLLHAAKNSIAFYFLFIH